MGEESKIEKLFKSMDKNGDGFVTREVLVYFITVRTLRNKKKISSYFSLSVGCIEKKILAEI